MTGDAGRDTLPAGGLSCTTLVSPVWLVWCNPGDSALTADTRPQLTRCKHHTLTPGAVGAQCSLAPSLTQMLSHWCQVATAVPGGGTGRQRSKHENFAIIIFWDFYCLFKIRIDARSSQKPGIISPKKTSVMIFVKNMNDI